jgi:putative membrane protein
MDRRIVLAGLAAAVVATPVLAQQSGGSSSSTMPSGTAASGSSMNQGAMRAGQMGQADMQHMTDTMRLGMVAMETSRIALTKAQNDDLKMFAQFEVQEQQTVSEILRSMMDPSATAATGAQNSTASQSNTSMASNMGNMQMDAQGREMVQKLQQASGAEFDRMYLQGQIQGHRDLLQVQERYLQSNSQSRDHMNIAKMARTQIREHIALLEDMQKKMK